MNPRLTIAKASLREHLSYDLGLAAEPVARILWARARWLTRAASLKKKAAGVKLMMRLHAAAFSPSVSGKVAIWLQNAIGRELAGQPTGLWACFDRSIEEAVKGFLSGANPNPLRLVGSRIFVIKAWRPDERGVLMVDYQYVFPLLAGLFDLEAIAARYDIVLEPSWAGVCTPEILLFTRLAHPVYVQTIEPRDHAFLQSLDSSLRMIPLAANWWVDPAGAPPPSVHRDIDVAMVAAWADIKRHWRFFRAISILKDRGHKLQVALVGYKYDRTREEIEALASHYGIRDQVTTYERISPREVDAILWRSKIHVLWSRRECANRAIVEAMRADVPFIVRSGLTYGFQYPYINARTGQFVDEYRLPEAILDMIQNRDRYQPRAWMLDNMTCERSTKILEGQLEAAAAASGQKWTRGLATRTSALDTQRYVNESDAAAFEADYAFLRQSLRKREYSAS